MGRSNQQADQKRVLKDRHARIGWGKFRNETLQDVLDNEPTYILWLDENTDIEIACDVLTEAQENASPKHYFSGFTARNDPRD